MHPHSFERRENDNLQTLPDRPTVGGMGRVSVTRHRVVRACTAQWGVYRITADNSLNPKTRYNALISLSSVGALPWYRLSFSTTLGLSLWCVSSSCSVRWGPIMPLPVASRLCHPSHLDTRAPRHPNRLTA